MFLEPVRHQVKGSEVLGENLFVGCDYRVLRITGAESDNLDRIMRDPRVIEEGVRITAREKQTRSVHTRLSHHLVLQKILCCRRYVSIKPVLYL